MKTTVFQFDKVVISDILIHQQIDQYLAKISEGTQYLDNGNTQQAMAILKEINYNLNLECNEYTKATFAKDLVFTSNLNNRYCNGVFKAKFDQKNWTNPNTLRRNFIEIYRHMFDISH